MNNKKKDTNPWNRNPPIKARLNSNSTNNQPKQTSSSEQKFKEAHVKLQAAVQKHAKDYESSSEEEEIESTNVIGSILKKYTETGGNDDHLGRTKIFLQESFQSGAATCLICISRIKRENSIWSCHECYCVFHLDCIQRWSKDSIVQQKQILANPIQVKTVSLTWGCPKCRFDYTLADIPDKYRCFCQKTTNPTFENFLAPHSCGEICRKDLRPKCGHQCLLLCHPGPCPPCPVTVQVSCYCRKEPATVRRCSDKEWSCGGRCGRQLACRKHSCSAACHAGDCSPCGKKSLQKCLCKSEQKLTDCAAHLWQCTKVCGRPLKCGNHACEVVCHEGGCDECPLTKLRTCPCGKSRHQLPCTKETPTCADTCDKLLDCGEHTCNLRCHKDACGVCLETVEKLCRCGLHAKEVQCYKPYLCETKCKQMKDCNKHPCNRKCCDGNCPPCEKPCGRTLACGNHKCNSVCHRGMCYPCNQTDTVACRCGATKIAVPCGRKHKTKPPKCTKLCSNPPDCHHERREAHRCHFGDCPPCRQKCSKARPNCAHPCPAQCHSAVLVKIEGQKASMPWEQTKPLIEKKSLPCPDCVVPMAVTCLGGHETSDWPCCKASPTSCQRPCGRILACTNHTCSLKCHFVDSPPDDVNSGLNCEVCEMSCAQPRPAGCAHECPRPCHAGACAPCKQMLRIRCHCGLHQPYVACNDWLDVAKREEIQCCGSQCPNNFPCGHRCRSNCHSGVCPNAELCKRKVKVACQCKRMKREFSCETVRNGKAHVECDDECERKKVDERKSFDKMEEIRMREEEIRNKRDLEKYKKMFEGKKKSRERRVYEEEDEEGVLRKYWFVFSLGVVLVAGGVLFLLQ